MAKPHGQRNLARVLQLNQTTTTKLNLRDSVGKATLGKVLVALHEEDYLVVLDHLEIIKKRGL